MALSDEVKERVSLVELAGETVTWDKGKTAAARGDWWAPCPFHGEKTSSFHVTEKPGRPGVFKCFGCNAGGSVIDFLMVRDGLSFAAAVRTLAARGRIETTAPDTEAARKAKDRAQDRQAQAEAEAERLAVLRLNQARRIWQAAQPAGSELVAYLGSRGIDLAALAGGPRGVLDGIPPTLRFHPDLPCYQGEGDDGRAVLVHRGPAMVAAIGRGRLVGVHRTWITPTGRARLEDGAKVPKQMKGKTGAIYGQPVRLTAPAPGGVLIVGEGIETTLAVLAAVRRADPFARVAAEAALSLGALCGPENPDGRGPGLGANGQPLPSALPDLTTDRPGWLPGPDAKPGSVMILADPSSKCPASAERHGTRALAKLIAQDFEPQLSVPLNRWDHDQDFADLAKIGELQS